MPEYNWEQIKVEYQKGEPLNAISRNHGCNRESIRKHARKDNWQRPDPSDAYMASNLAKATHSELLKFSPAYRKCNEERMKGRKHYIQVKSKLNDLKHQIKSLQSAARKNIPDSPIEKSSFLVSSMNKILSIKKS